jgi:hypothetical protein
MVRNQKIHLDANPAVACIRRDRPSGHEHPRGATEPITSTENGPEMADLGGCFKAGRRD